MAKPGEIRRIVFMGTPEFGAPVLRRLVVGGYDVVAVITQPDRPSGRERHLVSSPVKRAAIELGLNVLQPEKVRQPEFIDHLRGLHVDAIVVAAFGQILPRALLELAPFGAINVHASLLPDLRGASPISEAIACGYEVTGVSIMLMDVGLDTGPVLAQAKVDITVEDTTETLSARLAEVGTELLVETLPKWGRGQIRPVPQDERLASITRPLTKEDGHVDWKESAMRIERLCRAYYPWPGCYGSWAGKIIKLMKLKAVSRSIGEEPPGTIVVLRSPDLGFTGDWPAIVAGDGALILERIQIEGRKPISGQEFVRGARGFIGSCIGSCID